MPTTIGGWIIGLIVLACAILVILALVGVAASTPGWLPYLFIGFLGIGFYLHHHPA